MFDLLIINGVHYIFIGALLLGSFALMGVVSYGFFKDIMRNAKIEDDSELRPIDFTQLRLRENYEKLNAKARKGMN